VHRVGFIDENINLVCSLFLFNQVKLFLYYCS